MSSEDPTAGDHLQRQQERSGRYGILSPKDPGADSYVDIQEYLLLKGVEAVAIHGSKSCVIQLNSARRSNFSIAQEERQYAIKSFKSGSKDVMVASGVASKGLDFNDIQHVIIFSMPKEIEDYVHQIGRTGRSGKTGIATTFVNMNTPEQTLLDLKYLLMEAGQK